MESLTAENYLKTIYAICADADDEAASTGELARRLELAPGTVTGMLQRLDEARLIKYRPHQGARLTPAGRRAALRVIRRHRLMELFLTRTLGMSWDEVHEEAERLEHAASDRLVDRIDAFLGFPERDPHGDPIPDATGEFRAVGGESLDRCEAGTRFVLVRVIRGTPDLLRYLADGGLEIGAPGEVVENHALAGVITVESAERRTSLSRQMAEQILVRAIDVR